MSAMERAAAYLMWRECGFTPEQARALADGGYTALSWWRAEAWVPMRLEVVAA